MALRAISDMEAFGFTRSCVTAGGAAIAELSNSEQRAAPRRQVGKKQFLGFIKFYWDFFSLKSLQGISLYASP